MWMIICFFRSQCKNKVTNMADSKCNLQSSMEKEEGHGRSQDNHNQIFENHPEDTSDNRPVGLLHEHDLKNRDIENPGSNLVLSDQPFHCGSHKTDDKLDRFVYPGLRAHKSKSEGISKCLSAPILLPCADKSSRGTLLKAEEPICPTTTKVHPDITVSPTENSVHQVTTEVSFKPKWLTTAKVHSDLAIIPNKDPSHLEATEQTCDMTGIMSGNTANILPADKCYSLELKLNKDDEIDQKASEKSQEDFKHETGLVRYFETHIELIGTMVNEAHIVEGAVKEDTSSQEKDSPLSKLEISKAFGKKSKTWTSFYDSEDYSICFQPKTELQSKRPIEVHKGCKIDKTEEICAGYFRKDVQGECSNLTDDVCSISSVDQSQWKHTDYLAECPDFADEQPGPSNVSQRQKARNKQHQALLYAQSVRERLWKYHKNCCDEYQPCQTASKVLKQIKALENTELMQKTKQCPPSDEDLLEENPSLPPLPISLSKDRTLANQAVFSNMTCASLPNLSQYGNHQVCASHDDPSLISPIPASVNVDYNSATVTISFAGIDQPGINVAHSEHLNNVFSYDINLSVLQDPTKSFVRSETEMNTVSSTTLALPIIDSPAVDVVDGNGSLDDSSVSNLALPMINSQTDAIGSESVNHLSARPVELPAIYEPLLGVTVQKTNFENVTTSNLYLPVVGKIELPAIKILEGKDNVRGSQSVEPEISSINKIIAIPDPGIAAKPSLKNQSAPLNVKIKTRTSPILSEPNVDGMCANEENNMAVITLPTLNPFIGIIPNHGAVTAGENEFTQTPEPSKRTEFSNVSLDAQTHLTTSISYSNSIQDGEDISDWPKIADLVKHSSTISLSSNFDILNHTLVPQSIPKHENEYDTSNKSNTDLRDDKCEGAETMYNQPCHIDDHTNLAVEGLSFNCAVLQQYAIETDSRKSLNDMENKTFYNQDGTVEGLSFNCAVRQQYAIETDSRKSLNDMGNKTFYIQDGTSQLYGTPSAEQERIRILNTQDITEDQPDMSFHYSEYAEKAQNQMEYLEKVKGISHNLDSRINRGIMDHTSYKDSILTSNLDMVVNIRHKSEDPCRDQTEDAVYANDIKVNHKGHHLATPVNNRHSGEYEGRQDLLKDLPYHPDAKIQTSEAEYPQCQTNVIDIGNYSNLGTAFITDEAMDFQGYEEKSNVKVNSSVTSMVDINHVGENREGIANIFQDMLSSDSTAVSEKIGALAGSKRRDNVNAETSSDHLKTHFESDDSSGSKYKQKESDCNFDGSVNTLRKASGDVENCTTVCNSDATFNNGQAHQVGVMDTSLCNAEIPVKMSQLLLGVQKVPETSSKQTWSYQKSQINRQLKTTSNVPPANVKNKLKDYLSSRIYRRPFHSVFPFATETPSTEESEMVRSSTLRGKPSICDSDTTRPSLVLSDRYTENTRMEAVEYLTYLYARSPKPKVCSGSLEGLKVVSDMDDISVLANLHFCKVALPGKITKQDMSTDVQEVLVDSNLEPADPEHVYVPPNKKELKADDELAVLHVIYTLKKSLELFPNSETETD